MEVIDYGRWTFYLDADYEMLDPEKTGKWMYVFDDIDFAAEICAAAVENGVVCEAKHNSTIDAPDSTGVCCFYLDGDDMEAHERILSFLMDYDLIERDASGRLKNIPFKYDWQTLAGEYDDDFVPEITLSMFVDLDTGEWIG